MFQIGIYVTIPIKFQKKLVTIDLYFSIQGTGKFPNEYNVLRSLKFANGVTLPKTTKFRRLIWVTKNSRFK